MKILLQIYNTVPYRAYFPRELYFANFAVLITIHEKYIRESCTCVHDDVYTVLTSMCVMALYQYFKKASVLQIPMVH